MQKHTHTFTGEGKFPDAFAQMIVWDATANAYAEQSTHVSTHAKNSPSVAELNGDIKYLTSTSNSYYHTINNYIYDKKLNSLQRAQQALLVAEHPTKLNIDYVSLSHWASDNEPSLTLAIKNTTNLPASEITVGILDQTQIQKSNKINFLKTKSQEDQKKIINLTLDGNSELLLPIISLSEIKKHYITPNGYCLYGASTSHSTQERLPPPIGIHGKSSSTFISIPILYTYKSIFNQKYLVNDFVVLKYADRLSDFVVINGEAKTLECLN